MHPLPTHGTGQPMTKGLIQGSTEPPTAAAPMLCRVVQTEEQ